MDALEKISEKNRAFGSSTEVISSSGTNLNSKGSNGTGHGERVVRDSSVYDDGIDTDDPFRYGWRTLQKVTPDGSIQYEQIPLTVEDLLHPQEEDFRMQNPEHTQACVYLEYVLLNQVAHVPDAVVLYDMRVDLSIPGVEPFGPDITVTMQADIQPLNKGTFVVGEDGIAPILIIEVTSPTTRKQDFNEKPSYMQQASLPYYFVVDLACAVDERRVYGCVLNDEGYYVGIRPNERGWVWMEPVGLWLGLRDGKVECYDARGNLVLNYTELAASREAEAQRAESEKRRADEANQRAKEADARAETEAIEKQQLIEYLRSQGIDPKEILKG